MLLGGHDHFYFVSKGVTSWEDYDVNKPCLGSEGDQGDVLVIKSGTDFRDLTSIEVELEDVPETTDGAVRRKLIKSIKGTEFEKLFCEGTEVCLLGRRLPTKPGSPQSQRLKETLQSVLETVSASLKAPVAKSDAEIDLRSQYIRTQEVRFSEDYSISHCSLFPKLDGFKQLVRRRPPAYLRRRTVPERKWRCRCGLHFCRNPAWGLSLRTRSFQRISSTFIQLTDDRTIGCITLGDIMEILPFEDSLVVLELDGETIWAALETGLEPWPAQEG